MHHESSSFIRAGSTDRNSATTFSLSISPTELQTLLRSPSPPSASHIAQIPDSLASMDGKVRHFDDQLRRLRSEVVSLELKRKWARRQQEKYRSLLAPVRRLPTELLELIFGFYGSMNPNLIAVSDTELPGFVLMSVCARWRNLAQSCTGLWSNISLDLGFVCFEKSHYDSLRLPLKCCLDHAGDVCPLDITLNGTMSHEDSQEEPAVLASLTAQASRWRHVFFTTESSLNVFPSLARLVDKQMPLLGSIHLANDDELTDAELRMFRNAPRLRELSLGCDIPDRWEPNDVPHALTQIRNLALNPWNSKSGLFGLLPAFPSLQSLVYNLPTHFLHDEDKLPSQYSASVSSLEISVKPKTTDLRDDGFRTLLISACFPSLEKFIINLNGNPFVGANTANLSWSKDVGSFLQHSKCSLTTLQLEEVITFDDDLIDLLVQTSELRHFAFYQNTRPTLSERELNNIPGATRDPTSLTMAFIERLHAFGKSEGACYDLGNPLVPKLQTLSLRVFDTWFNDDQLFCDVARSRWCPDQNLAAEVGVECLKSVQVKILGRTPKLEIYESLHQLGMKVEVSGVISP